MNESQQKRVEHSGEISLVALATTFVRRRYTFFGTFMLITLAGLIYALVAPEKYEYVSLLQSAEKSNGEYIEEPTAIVATLANRWIPEVVSNFTQREETKIPFDLKVTNPENTGLIRIASEATLDNAKYVESIHEELVSNVIARQQRLVDSYIKSLNSQLTSLDRVIDSLRASPNGESAGSALAMAIEKRSELERLADSSRPAETLIISRQSVEREGPRRSLIVIFSVLLGGMLGVFLVFFSEFVVVVRSSLAESEG